MMSQPSSQPVPTIPPLGTAGSSRHCRFKPRPCTRFNGTNPSSDAAATDVETAGESETSRRPAAGIVDSLLRAAHLLRGVLTGHFAEFGLNDVRYAALRVLQAATPAGCTQAELADRLHQSESSISMLVERMRNDGLLYRLQSKSDRRKRLLLLTERGRHMLTQVDACHAQRMDRLLRRFSLQQKKSFSGLLNLLVEELSGPNPLMAETADLPPSREPRIA